MKCEVRFSMATYRWRCDTHEEMGDEDGCLVGAREEIADLRQRLGILENRLKNYDTLFEEVLVLRNSDRDIRRQNADLRKRLEEAERQYHELLFAVETKHDGETRHETALRYVRQGEYKGDGVACATLAGKGE